jgi:hypothetical protein
MSVMRRFADRVLARMVPEAQASACKETRCCDVLSGWKVCYYGCGRPAYCVWRGECSIGEGGPFC